MVASLGRVGASSATWTLQDSRAQGTRLPFGACPGILATIEVANVKALFQEYEARSVGFAQRLVRQARGGLDFHVRDPDGNVISFVEYRRSAPQGEEEHQ